MTPQKAPSLKSIISADYPSLLLFLLPTVTTAMYCALIYFGQIPDIRAIRFQGSIDWIGTEQAHVFLYMAIAVVMAGFPLLLLRVNSIRYIFENGQETTGVITKITRFKDRGKLFFEFQFMDKIIRVSQSVHFNKRVNTLRTNQNIAIIHDKDTPSKAYIKAVFI